MWTFAQRCPARPVQPRCTVGVAAAGAVFFAVLGSGHTLADYTRAMLWSASSSLLLPIVAVVISAQLTRVNKEPQPVATPVKVGLPGDQ
jgi:cation transporter-like permease